jgi:DNA-binding transcriptional regulator YhcF (GntR family)
MKEEGRRKWLPSEAYRWLVLAALSARGERAASKRELAWETRANHYMITRVLAELQKAGLVEIEAAADGYAVHATGRGRAFADEHREYMVTTFGAVLEAHFRYGTKPEWAPPR